MMDLLLSVMEAESSFLPYAAATAVAMVIVMIYWALVIRETEVQKLVKAIPCVEEGFWETAKIFFGPNAPSYILSKARSIHKIYRIPLVTPGSPAFVLVCDAKVARMVLEDSKSYKNRHTYRMFDDVAGGANFFTAEGVRWRHVRKSLAPAFTSEKSFYPAILTCVNQWIDTNLTPSLMQANHQPVVDVAEEMQKIAIDVIGRVGFDYEWDPNGDEARIVLEGLQIAYLDYFRYAVPTNVLRFLAGRLHPGRRQAQRAVNAMKNVFRTILQSHRERKAAGSNNYNPKSIVCALDENTNYESDEERICDMLLLCAGGYDTSSFTMSWILLELARHADEQTKLRSELSKCKSNEEAWNCPALKRVVRESMRLHATAALGSGRQLVKDLVVPSNDNKATPSFVIPAGSLCMTPFYAIQRDADIYERPDEFIPSRWISPSNEMMAAFMPYSLGRRNCVGQALANAELHVTIAELIRRYEFTVEQEGITDYYITLKNTGCLLRAKPVA